MLGVHEFFRPLPYKSAEYEVRFTGEGKCGDTTALDA